MNVRPVRTLPKRALLRARYGKQKTDHIYLEFRALAELRRQGRTPLHDDADPGRHSLHVAFAVPPFQRGSGGHTTLSNIVRALERRGHTVSLWLDDPGRRIDDPRTAPQQFKEWFGPFDAHVHHGFASWQGADVAVATGYQSVMKVRTLANTGARAYLVQDHEPEFFATSAERLHAEESYRQGFYAITAGTWLAKLMTSEYGLKATPFELAVDHAIYRPQQEPRSENVVTYYARAATPRRAVPLGLAALHIVKQRRPNTEIWLYGQEHMPKIEFPAQNLGVVAGPDLAMRYARATVGLSISLTNYSLVPQEMLACGLPCVEVGEPSIVDAFGHDGPVKLADAEPYALAEAIEQLLDDPQERRRRAQDGQRLVETRTWDAAAVHVEDGLRAALRERSG